jgi:hypothetical protein
MNFLRPIAAARRNNSPRSVRHEDRFFLRGFREHFSELVQHGERVATASRDPIERKFDFGPDHIDSDPVVLADVFAKRRHDRDAWSLVCHGNRGLQMAHHGAPPDGDVFLRE